MTPVKGLLLAFLEAQTTTPLSFFGEEKRRLGFGGKAEETEENRGFRASFWGLTRDKAEDASSNIFFFSNVFVYGFQGQKDLKRGANEVKRNGGCEAVRVDDDDGVWCEYKIGG